MKSLHKLLKMICAFILASGLCAAPVCAAPSWPEPIEIAAEGGILMDAASGAVLFEKNMHTPYYPASITKILTALIVIENCGLEETVTFSHDAVFNVEAGSTSAALDVGDQLSVRDCLYAMLLKSANEAANALAEHAAGSVSAFAEMMNQRAVQLGCTDSHFNNPSGLNDPNHYTSAHDMALIARAAFQNETFVEIDSTLYYDLPVTLRNPQGLRIYPGHRMLKKNASQYYPGIIGGKTGYTSLAGNTLVTCAGRNGLKLIAVVLNGHQTHYTDTRALLNYGFKNFSSVSTADIDTVYASIENDMTVSGIPAADLSVLHLEEDCRLVLPNNANYEDVTSAISYSLPPNAPPQAIAQISYQYGPHSVGSTYLLLDTDSTVSESIADVPEAALPESASGNVSETPDEGSLSTESEDIPGSKFRLALPQIHIPAKVCLTAGGIAAAIAAAAGLFFVKRRASQLEEDERNARNLRRQQRLEDIGVSVSEFEMLVKQKRTPDIFNPVKRPAKHPKKRR